MTQHPVIQNILETVARRHNIQVCDLLKPGKFAHLVAARREAIQILSDIGLKLGTIARIMQRDRTTILECTSKTRAAYKKQWHANRRRRWQEAREASA